MKWHDRLLVFLTGLLLICAAFALGLRLFGLAATYTFLRFDTGRGGLFWVLLLAAVLLLLVGLRLLVIPFSRREGVKGIFQVNDAGHVEIALEALESVARQAVTRVRGVNDLHLHIRPTEAGNVDIRAKLTVDGERHFPGLVEEVQQNIKTRVEQVAGVPVGEVDVVIAHISTSPSARMARSKLE